MTAAATLRAWCAAAIARSGAIAELDAVDWHALLAVGRAERLTPLLHVSRAVLAAPDRMPATFAAALAADYRESAGRAVLRERALGRLLARLADVHVEPVVLKGMAIADAVYGNAAVRPMDDVDLLVRRADVPTTARVLADIGYGAESLDPDLRHRAATQLAPPAASEWPVIDVHWDLVDARYGGAATRWSSGVRARAAAIELAGVPVRVLSPEDALIEAAVHLVVHHGLRGLLWCCDIALLGRGAVDWDRIVGSTVEARLGGFVFAALRAAELALGVVAPVEVMTALRPSSAVARGACRFAVPRLAAGRHVVLADYLLPPLLLERRDDLARLALSRLRRA